MFDSLFTYYGLDWLTLIFGIGANYLIAYKNRHGFALGVIACACGLSVAVVSQQYGFIVYNFILLVIMLRGLITWQDAAVDRAPDNKVNIYVRMPAYRGARVLRRQNFSNTNIPKQQ